MKAMSLSLQTIALLIITIVVIIAAIVIFRSNLELTAAPIGDISSDISGDVDTSGDGSDDYTPGSWISNTFLPLPTSTGGIK